MCLCRCLCFKINVYACGLHITYMKILKRHNKYGTYSDTTKHCSLSLVRHRAYKRFCHDWKSQLGVCVYVFAYYHKSLIIYTAFTLKWISRLMRWNFWAPTFEFSENFEFWKFSSIFFFNGIPKFKKTWKFDSKFWRKSSRSTLVHPSLY